MPHLRPGNMGSPTEPANAKPVDFVNSMADAMDTAFNSLLQQEGSHFELNTNSKEARDRRRIFVAVAQGVVRHLKDNSHALRVVTARDVPTGERLVIDTDGTLLGPVQSATP